MESSDVRKAASPATADGTAAMPAWFAPVAVAASLLVPFIALIVGAILLSQETRPARRRPLKTWVVATAAWLAVWLVAVFAVFGSAGGATSSCRGGIDHSVPPSYSSTDNVHWTGRYACVQGGSVEMPVPAGQVPGAGPS